jgi:hypothetical protein
MSTPLLRTYIRSQIERHEVQNQTSFPAKVLGWSSSDNTVRLEPQFVETWVGGDGKTNYEEVPDGSAYIDNVPVLFPRSGSWSITFPIETGSFGLVVCTKYSLDAFRNQGNRMDPGDLRRFTMSGATFHPVNLYPNSSTLEAPGDFDASVMELGDSGTRRFIALENLVAAEFIKVSLALDSVAGGVDGGGGQTLTGSNSYRPANAAAVVVGSDTVKASE